MDWTNNQLTGSPDDSIKVLEQSNTKIPFVADAGNATIETIIKTVTIPGGLMGANDSLAIMSLWGLDNANTDILRPRIRFGGIGGFILQDEYTTVANGIRSYQFISVVQNNNSLTAQKSYPAVNETSISRSSAAVEVGAIDTAADVDIVFTADVNAIGDDLNLEAYSVKLIRGV